MARRTDPWSRALVNQIIYGAGTEFGVLLADDVALHEIDEALSIAERSGDDLALGSMWSTTGIVLAHRDSRQTASEGWCCSDRSATCASMGGSTCPSFGPSTCTPHGRGPRAVTAMKRCR